MRFKAYFSTQSIDYAKYRPTYPRTLFEYLASLTVSHEKAWDCATGNGQAAMGLAPFFDRVIATDASKPQPDQATKHEKIIYREATAEKTEIESEFIDLVMVAQALYRLDPDGFYQEVKRVLKPGSAGRLVFQFIGNLTCDRPKD